MPNFKSMRTAEDIRRELTDIFRSLKDPRISGFLTIVKVDVSADLSYAKVYVSAMDRVEEPYYMVDGGTQIPILAFYRVEATRA